MANFKKELRYRDRFDYRYNDLVTEAQTQTQTESSDPIISVPTEIFKEFANTEMLTLIGLYGLLVLSRQFIGKNKNQLSTGREVGKSDIIHAAKMFFSQINPPPGVCEPSALWSGTPNYWFGDNFFGAAAQILLGKNPTTMFPDAGRGILALGIPGVGKTFAIIDRIIESAYAQGFSGIIYDKKGSQLALHYPLAMMYGYGDEEENGRIEVIAPGKDYSGVFNVFEVMRDSEDAPMASQIGKVIMENAGMRTDKGDAFFPLCGQSLATGVVQTAKSSLKYPDLALVYAIFKLDKLIERLEYNINRTDEFRLNPWIAVNFATFLSSKDAEKTVAGIKTQAQLIYTSFMQKDLLRCLIGKSTVPIKLDGKQLIIFEMDDKRKSVIAPLLATMIHLTVVENLSNKRGNPFFYSIDEAASLVLLELEEWINTYRSHGGLPIVGIQFLEQLYSAYGREKGEAIANALKTKIYFDPGTVKTAQEISSRFGKKDIIIKNVTTNTSNGNTTRSVSSQIHQVPIYSSDYILRLPQGKCIISSPGYGTDRETGFPYLLQIPIPTQDKEREDFCKKLWKETYLGQLRAKALKHNQNIDPTLELKLREIEAKELLPLPEEEAEKSSINLDKSNNSEEFDDEFQHFMNAQK